MYAFTGNRNLLENDNDKVSVVLEVKKIMACSVVVRCYVNLVHSY